MDRGELRASKTESNYVLPSSPDKKSCLAKENSVTTEKLIKESKTDKQGKSESSSSNTPHMALPASSNDSCQETLSCKLGSVCATDSSTCTDGNNPETTVLPAKTLDSVRTRNRDNLSGMRSSDNLSGMSSDNNYVATEHIDVSKSNQIENEAKKFTAEGKAEQVHAAPEVAKDSDRDFEASGSSSNSEKFLGTFMKMAPKVSDGLHGQELPSQTGGLSNIDLNEEVVEHNGEDWSAKETIDIDLMGSVSKPKPVKAKPGSLICFLPLGTKKEGKLGEWKGTTRNSAFHQPISTIKYCFGSKASPIRDAVPATKGFDLNLDAPRADSDVDTAESIFPSSTEAKKLDFDLNCASGNDENPHRSVRDFDLNDDPDSVPGEVFEAPRKADPDFPLVFNPDGSRRHDFRSFRPAFNADMPGFFPAHVQPFLMGPSNMGPPSEHLQRVSFLQPQLAYTPVHQTFRVGSKDGSYPTGMVPYMVNPHAMGPGSVPAFAGPVFQVPQGLSRVNNGGSASNPIMEEQTKGFQFSGAKRREPEGGWDSPQLCFRQVASSWR